MTYLNILEKFKVLFNTLLDFKIILIFSVLLILLTFLYIIKKLNSKRYTKCIILSLIIVLLMGVHKGVYLYLMEEEADAEFLYCLQGYFK